MKKAHEAVMCSRYTGRWNKCPHAAKWLVYGHPVCGRHATSEGAMKVRRPIRVELVEDSKP